jgi:hypothetical protein
MERTQASSRFAVIGNPKRTTSHPYVSHSSFRMQYYIPYNIVAVKGENAENPFIRLVAG